MPFTPLHMGPGLMIKALTGDRFSILSFGVAQVAMDIEPLIGMVRGSFRLHGPTHTYLAALIIAGLVALVSQNICRPILRRWNHELSFCHLDWLITHEPFSQGAVIMGTFIGAFSHVALDSIMHIDITPLAPWSNNNGLLGIISGEALHQWCIGAGLFGIFWWVAIHWHKRQD
ncbi:conserved membrane hypothetical protein [Gammaproteobacteria bacterium]